MKPAVMYANWLAPTPLKAAVYSCETLAVSGKAG